MFKVKILDVDETHFCLIPLDTKFCNQAFRIQRKKRICAWDKFTRLDPDTKRIFRASFKLRKYISRSIYAYRYMPFCQAQYLGSPKRAEWGWV